MAVLVAYASKHGATQEIAERIAQTLAAAGQQAQVRPVSAAGDLAGSIRRSAKRHRRRLAASPGSSCQASGGPRRPLMARHWPHRPPLGSALRKRPSMQ
jgi:flavodoxin-like protein